jgi:hypothetical protein
MSIFDIFKKKEPTELRMSFPEENLEKSVKPHPVNPVLIGEVEKSKVILDLETNRINVDNIYLKTGRLSDRELRDIAAYDSVISLIVTTRCNQAMAFSKRTRSKYSRGFLLREVIPVQDDKRIPPKEKDAECTYRSALADAISKWIGTCGTTNSSIVEYVFKGSDTFFKQCNLTDYLCAQTRNLITFGRFATQIIRNKDGVPIMWRPIPVETLFRVIDGRMVRLARTDKDVNEPSAIDADAWSGLPEGERPVAYVQRINGKNVAFFTEDEIQVKYYQKQAFEGLNGYPMAPIEMAYYTILMNFYAQQYMQNAFTKGLGAKGIISLKTTEGDFLSKEDVENFRKLFSNYVARNDNSATVPIVAGAVEVEWVPLAATAKDMEFVNLYTRVIQTVCASLQISPHEIGFGGLDPEGATVSDGGKQEQIVQGEERGLRQILELLFDSIYEIVEEAFPQAKGTFILEPVGLGQNTKEGDLALYKEELQTSGTFAKIWSDSERTESFPFGGNVPTSPVFHQFVAKYMKYSEMREYFFHEEGALKNPAYDFLIDPALNEAYQQLKNQMPELEKQSAMMNLEQQKMEMSMAASQPKEGELPPQEEPPDNSVELEKEKHDAKLQMEKEKHDQKMKHDQQKHELNLRLTIEKTKQAKMAETQDKINSVVQAVKTI